VGGGGHVALLRVLVRLSRCDRSGCDCAYLRELDWGRSGQQHSRFLKILVLVRESKYVEVNNC